MKQLNSIIQYAKRINRLDYFTKKIALDSFMTFLEKRELDEIQMQIAEYENRNFNGKMPELKDFIRVFIVENNLNSNPAYLQISKKTIKIIEGFMQKQGINEIN